MCFDIQAFLLLISSKENLSAAIAILSQDMVKIIIIGTMFIFRSRITITDNKY